MANGWRSSKVTSAWAPLTRENYFAMLRCGFNETAQRVWVHLMMLRRDWPGDKQHGEVKITQREIGEALNIKHTAMVRAIKRLKEFGCLSVMDKGHFKVMSPLEARADQDEANTVYTQTKVEKTLRHEADFDVSPNGPSRAQNCGLIGREVNKVIYVNKSNLVSQGVEEDLLAFLDD